jgi:hypothetical protein
MPALKLRWRLKRAEVELGSLGHDYAIQELPGSKSAGAAVLLSVVQPCGASHGNQGVPLTDG